jgi:MEMO1 family protein
MTADRNHGEFRKAMVAGTFYPADPVQLSRQLAEMFSRAKKRTLSGQVKAIVAPHAGYIYSGQVAADVYKQIEGEQYDSVVVIAPFHGFFKGVSVYSGDGYETPLGMIEIDRALSDAMAEKHPNVFSSTVGHTGSGGHGEHSLEVQLPFLQMVLGKFKMVAMVMGDQEESTIRAAAEALAATLKGTNTLLVASTDMSHFHPEKEARRLDKCFETALQKFDANSIIATVSGGRAEACGFGPVAAVIEATHRMGGEEVEIISYDTSGSATGDLAEVVGYLSAVIIGKKDIPKAAPIGTPKQARHPGYSDAEKKYLRDIARIAVEARAHGQKPEYSEPPSPHLEDKRGVFVTLTKKGQLRGCIGLVQAKLPLIDAVTEMAVAAAFEDPRFPQVTVDELPELEFEISVMTPLVLVTDINQIIVGRDGLMVRHEMHSGLLLPQVATEYKWNRDTFLEQTCLKAGLPKSSYRDRHAQIYKFTVEKF